MEEQTQDVAPEVLETPEPVEETVETPELSAEEIAALKEKASKADELEAKNKQLYERAKKAEAAKPEPSKETGLSNKDVLVLAKANVDAEDIDEIVEYATFKKISVADALASNVIKTLLADKAEERRTANATQTRGSRGSSKVSGEDLLSKAEKTGEVPESDEGMQELFKARMTRRFSK